MAKLERWILSALVTILRVWPRAAMRPLVGALSFLTRHISTKESRQFDRNVDQVLGLPAHSEFARMFKAQASRHQMACAVETLQAIHDPSCIEVTGYEQVVEHVRQAEERGKGHLILTAHLGSWELVAYFGAQAARRPFHVLAKPARRRSLTDILNQLRERMGVEVFWTDRKTLVRDMLKALRAGESVGFVMDQKPDNRVGPKVQFFERETAFVSGPAAMTLKTGALPIFVFCVREGPYRFRLISSVFENAVGMDETELTQAMAEEIERVIRLYPEQWTWSYKRWRDLGR